MAFSGGNIFKRIFVKLVCMSFDRIDSVQNMCFTCATKCSFKQVVKHFLRGFFFQDVQTLYLSQDIETHSCINWKPSSAGHCSKGKKN